MTLCRFTLTPRSPWSGKLRSDTLYGLVCWHIAEREGDGACQKLIVDFRDNRPPFELSSAMRENCLPMPFLPPPDRDFFHGQAKKLAKQNEPEDAALFGLLQKYKKFRKAPWLPMEVWTRHKDRLSSAALFLDMAFNKDEKEPEPFSETAFEPHVSIDRQTGAARDGQLFFTRLQYFISSSKFHLYARADDVAFLLKYLKIIGEAGFGKDASVGNGKFDAEIDESFAPESLNAPDANASLLLSVCSAPKMDDLHGFYNVEVKRGKTGPGYANPFKNPLLMLKEGSLLTAPLSGPFVFNNIAANRQIVQIMQPLALPCVLDGMGVKEGC